MDSKITASRKAGIFRFHSRELLFFLRRLQEKQIIVFNMASLLVFSKMKFNPLGLPVPTNIGLWCCTFPPTPSSSSEQASQDLFWFLGQLESERVEAGRAGSVFLFFSSSTLVGSCPQSDSTAVTCWNIFVLKDSNTSRARTIAVLALLRRLVALEAYEVINQIINCLAFFLFIAAKNACNSSATHLLKLCSCPQFLKSGVIE